MNKKFLIRFHGNRNSVAIPYIEQFGRIEFYDPNEALENFQTLIVECCYTTDNITVGLCNALFKAGKTIGFIGITQKELLVLSECTGREHKMEGKNIFVRPIKNGPKNTLFKYTIFSNYTNAEILDELTNNKNTIYNTLSQKVFGAFTAAPVYHVPPLPTNTLYPVGDYQMIYGSRLTAHSHDFTLDLRTQGYTGTQYVNGHIEVDAYVYLTKETNGVSDYRVILHTKLTNITPTGYYTQTTNNNKIKDDYFPPDVENITYGYMVSISPQVAANRGLNVQASVPNSDDVSSSNTYGYNILTRFGLQGKYAVNMLIKTQLKNGNPYDLSFTPDFLSMLNQQICPNLVNYVPTEVDTLTASVVNFQMENTTSDATSPGQFEMISYFIMDAIEGETSFPVTFTIEIECMNWKPPKRYGTGSFVLDLAKLTNAINYNPPNLI